MHAILLLLATSGQLMDADKQAKLTALLPRLDNPDFQAVLDDPRVVWYTHAEMPPAFQHGPNGEPTSFHSAYHNFSADPSDSVLPRKGLLAGGHANGEFPWITAPGGAHRAAVKSFKGLSLPLDDSGRTIPVAVFQRRANGRVNSVGRVWVRAWAFPIGTVLIEALTQRHPDGFDVVFEIRFRIREEDAWGVEIFRPYATAEELADAIERLPEATAKTRAAVPVLREETALVQVRLTDANHRRMRAIDVTTGVFDLPPISTDDLDRLLAAKSFTSALGEAFKANDDGEPAFAPANLSQSYSLVPPNYWGTITGNSRETCIKCHQGTNKHATEFESPRGWYGRVRGSDGIFSFHPVEPSSIASNGMRYPVRYRQALLDAGVIAIRKPTRPHYSLIKGIY